MYFSRTPPIAKLFFKDIIWNIPTQEKILYLTFDDGPTPEITEWTLNLLKKYNAKATFFCIGKNVKQYPEIFNKIIEEKHSIGNHSYDHLNGWKTSTENYIENVNKCEKVISDRYSVFGKKEKKRNRLTTDYRLPITLFRPPYGKITPTQYSKLHTQYSIVMWDVLSGDFDTSISGEKCFSNVVKNAKNGSVVVFHDSRKASKNLFYALPKTLEYFSEKGFRFECLTPTLSNGEGELTLAGS